MNIRLGLPAVTLRQFPWLVDALANYSVGILENPCANFDAAAGWGQKISGNYARRLAKIRGLACWTLEDGFYRSVGLGKSRAPSFSVVLDQHGVYFDARKTSNLELLLAQPVDAATVAMGASLRDFIVARRLTKYNNVPDRPLRLDAVTGRRRILLIDQVAGDMSLSGAGANPETFAAMWRAALDLMKQGDASVFAKAHPDVVAGYAQGMLSAAIGVEIASWVPSNAATHAVLDEVDEIWTASSQFGFDALLRGKKVVCFASPFFAGWGLTEDRPVTAEAKAALKRRADAPRHSIDALAGSAIGRYPIYFDPVAKCPVPPEKALERLADWRDGWFEREGRVLGIGIAWHKRSLIRAHLGAAGHDAKFVRKEPASIAFDRYSELLIWGDRVRKQTIADARTAGMTVTTVEDGFIRSRGLSSRSNLPVSLCFDSRAAHYDASTASDLEIILQTHDFSGKILEMAANLRASIITAGISKYNIPDSHAFDIAALAEGRPILLVVAQVPGDVSLRLGLAKYLSNIDFLAAVRHENPDSFIVFKEHPDLSAGIRPGKSPKSQTDPFANLHVHGGDITKLYKEVDQVHVMTSLSGFEALIRNRTVVCHGLPFYAGWGLTSDRMATARRTRNLTIDELIAGALIEYPRYMMPNDFLQCSIFDLVGVVRGLTDE